MYKTAIVLYIVCFSLYIFFSRQPDYLDGELTKATIHFIKDSSTGKAAPYATFSPGKKTYTVSAGYYFRHFKEGERVDLIYETAKPQRGAVYTFWGYWITPGEIFFSIGLIVAMYFIAVSITSNPVPEAVMEQLEYKPVKKRKYKD